MTQTIARIKQKGKHFEVLVDLNEALKYKKGENSSVNFLEADKVFTDSKKGLAASVSDLKDAFGTEDSTEVAGKIVKSGEILISQEQRDEEKEKKFKQVVDFLVVNASDQNGNKISPERIKSALDEAHVSLKNVPLENQISEIVEQLTKIMPIKIASKKIKLTIPAIHTGKAYGLINQYKEKEDWLENGDLETVLVIPVGLIMDFYDKLNSISHGSILSEEIKEE